MKQLITLILFVSVFSTHGFAQTGRFPSLRFVNKDSVYDFGEVGENEMAQYEFELQNTGTEPIVIDSMNCELVNISFKLPSKPIKAGKKGKVTVIYKAGNEIGSFKADIFTTANNVKSSVPFIHISGAVVPQRSNIPEQDYPKGKEKKVRATITAGDHL